MILNSNFNPKVEGIVVFSKSLTSWFSRNQEWLAYFELTHAGCTQFENSATCSDDIKILGKMANAALTYIEANNGLSAPERVKRAEDAICIIYEEYKEDLSDNARRQYAIYQEQIDEFENANVEENINTEVITKNLVKRNGTKNRRPGKGHRH